MCGTYCIPSDQNSWLRRWSHAETDSSEVCTERARPLTLSTWLSPLGRRAISISLRADRRHRDSVVRRRSPAYVPPAARCRRWMDVAMDTVQWKRDLAELWSAGMHAYRLNCQLPSCPCLSVDAGALVPHSDADCRLMRSCRDCSDRFNDHRYWTNRNTQLESRSRIGVLFRFFIQSLPKLGGGM